MTIHSLADADIRTVDAHVAGRAALLVAKLYKLSDRQQTPDRLVDKDAYDVYRLLAAVPTHILAAAVARLLADDFAGAVTSAALDYLAELFGRADSGGSVMAGRTEELVGSPETVAAACAALTGDLLASIGR